MDPRLEKLRARISELIAWNEEITVALQKNPDSEERRRLAGELAYIQKEMKSIEGERDSLRGDSPALDSTPRDAITSDETAHDAGANDAAAPKKDEAS